MTDVTTTLVFRGLCTFIERKDENKYEAYLLAGAMDDGADAHDHDHDSRKAHIRSLAIPIASIEHKEADLTWLPTAVIHGSGGPIDQIGVWIVPPGVLKLEVTPAQLGKLPDLKGRSAVIDLHKLHTADKSKAKLRDEILRAGATVIDLQDGVIISDDFTKFDQLLLLRGADTEPFARGGFARAFKWAITGKELRIVISNPKGEKITLREGAAVGITNVAPVPAGEGVGHFAHYYGVFVTQPGDNRKVQLKLGTQDEPVFDCVPPTESPKP